MGDNLVPNGLSRGCKVFFLQVEVAEIIVHEAGEPDAVIDLLDAESLASRCAVDTGSLVMMTRLAVSGYRSLREVRVALGALNVVTGANGSGKSRAIRKSKPKANGLANDWAGRTPSPYATARVCAFETTTANGGKPTSSWRHSTA